MNTIRLDIGNKTAKLPLIQGGMGVGISLAGLAGAVAREGGIGIISSAQIGFREPDFGTDSKKANLRAMALELQKARAIAAGPDGRCEGLLGFNIMVATRDYGDYVRTAASAGADVIISGAGLPVDLPKYVEGTDTLIAPIVSSEKAARIILKMWDRHYRRTADFLVIEGAHAGGHLGFSREDLERMQEEGFVQNLFSKHPNELSDPYGHILPSFRFQNHVHGPCGICRPALRPLPVLNLLNSSLHLLTIRFLPS